MYPMPTTVSAPSTGFSTANPAVAHYPARAVSTVGGTYAPAPCGSLQGAYTVMPQAPVQYGAPMGTYVPPAAMYSAPLPQKVPQGCSYVPPPNAVPTQQGVPSEPPKLTEGMPDPNAIASQKDAYSKSLEEQAKHGEEMLRLQQKQQTDYIFQAAEAQKRQLMCQIDQQAKQQELALSQKYSQQQMSLQQEYQHQKLVLEKQANDLSMEYQRRKAQEDMMSQQYEMQKAHYDDQMRIVSEMQKQHGATQQPGQQPPPMPTGPGPYMGQGPYAPPAYAPQGNSYVPPPVPLQHAPTQACYGGGGPGSFVPPPAPLPPAMSYGVPSAPSYAAAYPVGTAGQTSPGYSVPTENYAASAPSGYAPPMEPAAYPAPMQTSNGASQYTAPPTQYMAPATQYATSTSHYTVPPTQYAGPVASPYGMAPATSYAVAPTQYNPYAAAGSHYEVPPTAIYGSDH